MLFILLAVPLWRDRRLLSAHLPVLAVAVGCGAISSVIVGIGFALGGKVPDLAFVLSVKSAPTAATLQFVGLTGGPLGLTVVLVVATGILGASLGQSTLRIFGVTDERAQGLALGVAASAMGIAQAFRVSPTAGGFASVGMILNGFATIVLSTLVAKFVAF